MHIIQQEITVTFVKMGIQETQHEEVHRTADLLDHFLSADVIQEAVHEQNVQMVFSAYAR